MMIIALKTRKLLIKIAIGKAREGGEVGLGEFLRSMEFFWFYLHAFFFEGFSPGFDPTASSGSTQVFFCAWNLHG